MTRSLKLSAVFGLMMAFTACVGQTPATTPDATPDPSPAPTPDPMPEPTPEPEPTERPKLQNCTQAPLPSGLATTDWNHFTTEVIVAAGDPDHSAQDVLTIPGRTTSLPGKFTYGAIGKDLEDEAVEVWMDDCSGAYTRLGETVTDDDGRSGLVLSGAELPPVGVYSLYTRVLGDGSAVRSTLRVLPAGTQLIVFDIDATLTTDDKELFIDLADDLYGPIKEGDYDPQARAGATEITEIRHAQGYALVYLTGRPYWLTRQSRQWLADHDIAPGNLHVTDRNRDILPVNDSVGEYKTRYLNELREIGFEIVGAYGNATTDIFAYNNVGVPGDRTWILGKNGGQGGSVDLGDDYLAHLPEAEAEAPPTQTFVR